MLYKAVFLDRDGTINEEVGHLSETGKFNLYANSARAIRMLNDAGFKVIVVTNQAGVAKGYFDEEKIKEIHAHMKAELAKDGAKIDGTYYCPHHPEFGNNQYRQACLCRKPEPGMVLQAARDFNIDLSRSFMVGDTLKDIIAGKRAGCNTILVLTGHGKEAVCKIPGEFTPSFVSQDLFSAASWLLL